MDIGSVYVVIMFCCFVTQDHGHGEQSAINSEHCLGLCIIFITYLLLLSHCVITFSTAIGSHDSDSH